MPPRQMFPRIAQPQRVPRYFLVSLLAVGSLLIFLGIPLALAAWAPAADAAGGRVPSGRLPASDDLPSQTQAHAAPGHLIAGQNPGLYYLDWGDFALSPVTHPVRGSARPFTWAALEPSSGAYNWALLDNWVAARTALGLSTGIFVSTYDGTLDGDIRSTPNFVISTPGTTVVTDEYVDYLGQTQNGHFEYDHPILGHLLGWDLASTPAGAVEVAQGPGGGWAGRLGGINGAQASLTHWSLRVPAMPPELVSGTKAEIWFSVYTETSDFSPNADRLYGEILDDSVPPNVLSTLYVRSNTSGTNGAWVQVGPINVSPYVGRNLRIRFRTFTDGANPTTFWLDDVKLQVRLIIPKYWSEPYLSAYASFVQALGGHLRDDERVDFVALGTGLYGETQPAEPEYQQYLIDAGLTSAGWVSTVNRITDLYVASFSAGATLRKNLLLQYAPYFLSPTERKQVTDDAAAKLIGLSYNGLLPDWVGAVTGEGWGSYDPIMKYHQTVPIAWESYPYMLCTPVFTYWSILSALDKHADYIRLDSELLTGSQGVLNRPLFEWAEPYWGKTAQSSCGAWVALREHRNPTPFCHTVDGPTYADSSSDPTWPQLGNYRFYLFQDDTIPGGRTIPETNDPGADRRFAADPYSGDPWPEAGLGNCPTTNLYSNIYGPNYPCYPEPYNPALPPLEGSDPNNYYDPWGWSGNGKEAWTIRRTDQASGNRYMWFVFDNAFIDGSQTYGVKVTVKYFDIGTDTWTLRYDASSGEKVAGTITKTNTRQLREATFTLSDARFATRLANNRADFVLDANNDGDEFVHLVEVTRLQCPSGEPPTPTPTSSQTATATSTGTRTVTPTPTASLTPTRTATATSSSIATPTRTATATPTASLTPTRTATTTSTASVTPTRTGTAIPTASSTPTATASSSPTRTPTLTPSRTSSPTTTGTPSLATIGDRVWLDGNQNGVQNFAEPGVGNVTVRLYDGANTLVGTTTTDTSGIYLFSGLTPGVYCVEFALPPGYAFSSQNQGADPALDSDPNPATGRTVCTSLDPGETDRTWDAGIYLLPTATATVTRTGTAQPTITPTPLPGCIFGYKIDDQHFGLPGWHIETQLANGSGPVYETDTDGTGYFAFPALTPGRYRVWETLREGWVPVTDPVFEVNVWQGPGCTRVRFKNRQATPTPAPLPTWPAANIEGYVFLDTDADDNFDAGERGISQVMISISNAALMREWVATTGEDGFYRAHSLPVGQVYQVAEIDTPRIAGLSPAARVVKIPYDPAGGAVIVSFGHRAAPHRSYLGFVLKKSW